MIYHWGGHFLGGFRCVDTGEPVDQSHGWKIHHFNVDFPSEKHLKLLIIAGKVNYPK